MLFQLEFVYDSSQTEVGFALDFFLCRCGIDFCLSLKNLLLERDRLFNDLVNSRKNALEIALKNCYLLHLLIKNIFLTLIRYPLQQTKQLFCNALIIFVDKNLSEPSEQPRVCKS